MLVGKMGQSVCEVVVAFRDESVVVLYRVDGGAAEDTGQFVRLLERDLPASPHPTDRIALVTVLVHALHAWYRHRVTEEGCAYIRRTSDDGPEPDRITLRSSPILGAVGARLRIKTNGVAEPLDFYDAGLARVALEIASSVLQALGGFAPTVSGPEGVVLCRSTRDAYAVAACA